MRLYSDIIKSVLTNLGIMYVSVEVYSSYAYDELVRVYITLNENRESIAMDMQISSLESEDSTYKYIRKFFMRKSLEHLGA